MSFVLNVQSPVVEDRTYTYALPDCEPFSSSPRAPMSAMSPEMDTEQPKLSYAEPSAATSFARRVHAPAFDRSYTYAAPA